MVLLSAYDGAGPKPRTASTASFDQVPPVSTARWALDTLIGVRSPKLCTMVCQTCLYQGAFSSRML